MRSSRKIYTNYETVFGEEVMIIGILIIIGCFCLGAAMNIEL